MKNRYAIITGPRFSSGRSGASWGTDYSHWDNLKYDSIGDVRRNIEQAEAKGFGVILVSWKQNSLIQELGEYRVNSVEIEDPYMDKPLEQSELSETNIHFRKNFSHNDQRQWYAIKKGLDLAVELGASSVLRIRSDQLFNWDLLEEDFNLALQADKLLFPAQKSLLELDFHYSGFCVCDFFFGGRIQDVYLMVKLSLLGGRFFGPHQDLIWKSLPFNEKWFSHFPGLTTFKGLQSESRQKTLANVFWNEIASPASRETMNSTTWRGIKLRSIDYLLSREKLNHGWTVKNFEDNEAASSPNVLSKKDNYDWEFLAKYISGTNNTSSRHTNDSYVAMYFDFSEYIGHHRIVNNAKISVLGIAFRGIVILLMAYIRSSQVWNLCSTMYKKLIRSLS